MWKRLRAILSHEETDRKIKERDRLAMEMLIKDQKNRVTFVEARTGAAKSVSERMKYKTKLREERRQLAQLENPDEQQFFDALGIEI